MRTALLLIAMMVVANASMDWKKMPINLSGKRNILTVLSQIEAQISAGGPLDIIYKTLDDFTNAVTEEQASHDALNERSVNECNAEFEFRAKEVGDADGALKQGQQTLDGCTDQKTRATNDKIFNKKVTASTETFLQTLISARQQETEAFNEAKATYEYNVSGLEEAIEILEQIFTGETSMVQLVQHAHKLLFKAVKLGMAHLYAPTYAALAQVTAGADNEVLEQVRNLLVKLRSDVEEKWNETLAQESAAQDEFNDVHTRTVEQLEALAQQSSDLDVELANLNKCIITQTGIVQSASAKRDRNQRLWDEASALCETSAESYVAATAQRREELDLIDALRSKVEARFAGPK